MQKTLPKGHTSCLAPQFKYTSAVHTDLGDTFARIKGQLKGQSEEDGANVYSLPKSAQMHFRPVLNCNRPYTRQRMNVLDPRLLKYPAVLLGQ